MATTGFSSSDEVSAPPASDKHTGWAKKLRLIMLGELTIYPQVAKFLWCICTRNYENWLTVDKVIAKIVRLTFLAHPVQ